MNTRITRGSNSAPIREEEIPVFTKKPGRDFLVNCAAKAAHNAEEFMSAEEWQEQRVRSGNPARADILMAFDPQPEKETT